MTVRYVLAPEAALDLVQIWRYIKKESSVEMAGRVETVIREKMGVSGTDAWRRTSASEPDGP
jgi:plasmid stabilization system protein ParE